MKKTYLAYIAGFLDGEGCVSLSKVYRKDNRNKKPRFKEEMWGTVQVAMANINTQRELLMELRNNFGGYYAEFKNRGNKNTKDTIFWRLTSHKSAEFLKRIIFFLRIKKRQAEIVIRYQELTKKNRGKHKDPSEKEIQERKNLLIEIRQLNKRGK